MTPRQVSVLARSAAGFGYGWSLQGTDLSYEHQRGCDRQVAWVLSRKLVYKRGGRLIANSGGRKTRVHHRSIAGYTIVNPQGGTKFAKAA